MSLTKFEIALSLMLMLTAAGTFSLSAQTPGDNPPNRTATTEVSITETEKAETQKKSRLSVGSAESSENDKFKRTNIVLATSSTNRTKPLASSVSSAPQADSDAWQFQFSPYLWIASISGRAGIGNLVTDTSTSITDPGVELNFGLMGTLEARKNKLIFLTDLQYSDLATEKGNPGPLFSSTRASFKTFILDPEVGYRVFESENGASVDLLGGIRYWHLNATLDFRAGVLPAVQVSRSRGWVDAVAGLRGRAPLWKRLFLTGKADLGGGGSEFTYQLFGGAGIAINDRIALIGGYRHLSVDYNKDGFLFDMALHGPILGFGIKF